MINQMIIKLYEIDSLLRSLNINITFFLSIRVCFATTGRQIVAADKRNLRKQF